MKTVEIDDDQLDMALACITQCLWHTDFFFKSGAERRLALSAYEALSGRALPVSLHRRADTEGH